ncbi:hypothetical protein AUP68_09144 [Ilyonectria robusta]
MAGTRNSIKSQGTQLFAGLEPPTRKRKNSVASSSGSTQKPSSSNKGSAKVPSSSIIKKGHKTALDNQMTGMKQTLAKWTKQFEEGDAKLKDSMTRIAAEITQLQTDTENSPESSNSKQQTPESSDPYDLVGPIHLEFESEYGSMMGFFKGRFGRKYVLFEQGPSTASRHRLVSENELGQKVDERTTNNLCGQQRGDQEGGKIMWLQDAITVPFSGTLDFVSPLVPKKCRPQGDCNGDSPITRIVAKWKIGDKTLLTVETRTTVRKMWFKRGKTTLQSDLKYQGKVIVPKGCQISWADLAIIQVRIARELKYEKGQKAPKALINILKHCVSISKGMGNNQSAILRQMREFNV